MNQRPKMRAKTIKFLEGKHGVTFAGFISGNGFLDMTPRAQTTKENNR